MRHNAQWKIVMPSGRFSTDAHKSFFERIANAFRDSREFTRSELAVEQIQDSLENDIKSGARVHEHGNDVQTISRNRMAVLESNITAELIEAEAQCVREEIAALEELLKNRQHRLQELQGARGFVDSRTIELSEIRERMARRDHEKKQRQMEAMTR